jgi:hypothetical protein
VKKILTGCLIVFVIALACLGVAGFYAYRIARPMIDSAGGYVARARELSRLGERVNNKTTFVPPANGELSDAQIERFIAVQTKVRIQMGNRWNDIEKKAAEVRKKTEGEEHLSLAEVTSIFSDLANLYIDARRAQVTALNTQKFSDAEYGWVRKRVWEAAGMHVASGLDLSQIEDLARQGAENSNVDIPDIPTPDVPEKNIQLIKPHATQLKEWIPLAVLGL